MKFPKSIQHLSFNELIYLRCAKSTMKGGSIQTREYQAKNHGLAPSTELSACRCIIRSLRWKSPLNHIPFCPTSFEDIQTTIRGSNIFNSPLFKHNWRNSPFSYRFRITFSIFTSSCNRSESVHAGSPYRLTKGRYIG